MEKFSIAKFLNYCGHHDLNGDRRADADDIILGAEIARTLKQSHADRFRFEDTAVLDQLPRIDTHHKDYSRLAAYLPRDIDALLAYFFSAETLGAPVKAADVLTGKAFEIQTRPEHIQSALDDLAEFMVEYVRVLEKMNASPKLLATWAWLRDTLAVAAEEGLQAWDPHQKRRALTMAFSAIKDQFSVSKDYARMLLSAFRTLKAATQPFEYYSEKAFKDTIQILEKELAQIHPKVVAVGEGHSQVESWLAVLYLAEQYPKDLHSIVVEVPQQMQSQLDHLFDTIQESQEESEMGMELDRLLGAIARSGRGHGIISYAPGKGHLSARIHAMRTCIIELMRRGIRFYAGDLNPSEKSARSVLGSKRDRTMADTVASQAAECPPGKFVVFLGGAAHVAPGNGGMIDLIDSAKIPRLCLNLAYLGGLPKKYDYSRFDVDVNQYA